MFRSSLIALGILAIMLIILQLSESAGIYIPKTAMPIGMSTRGIPTKNLPNAGSHGSNPTPITTNSSWKPPTVVTSGSTFLAERTRARTAIRFCDWPRSNASYLCPHATHTRDVRVYISSYSPHSSFRNLRK